MNPLRPFSAVFRQPEYRRFLEENPLLDAYWKAPPYKKPSGRVNLEIDGADYDMTLAGGVVTNVHVGDWVQVNYNEDYPAVVVAKDLIFTGSDHMICYSMSGGSHRSFWLLSHVELMEGSYLWLPTADRLWLTGKNEEGKQLAAVFAEICARWRREDRNDK